MIKKAWKSLAISTALLSSLTLPYQAAFAQEQAHYTLAPQEKNFQLAVDKRSGENIQELKKDPARAFLLSLLYPGLGHFYVGNDNQRAFWITGAGTLIIVGSIIGYGILSEKNQGTVTGITDEQGKQGIEIGNLLITVVLLGYHLWNVRDAYLVADEYNRKLMRENMISEWEKLQNIRVSYNQDTLYLHYQFNL